MFSRNIFDIEDISRECDLIHSPGKSIAWEGPANTSIVTIVPPSVYPPREDTHLLATAIYLHGKGGGRRFLEVGVGSGVVTTFASLQGWVVSGCDINPMAVSCTRGLLREHGVDASTIFEGGPSEDGFTDEGETENDDSTCAETGIEWAGTGGYDLIVWNLPYLAPTASGEPHLGPLEEAGLVDFDGADGKLLESLERYPQILNRSGTILLLCNDAANGLTLRSRWMARGWASRILERRVFGDGEILRVLELWRPWQDSSVLLVDEIDSTNSHLLDFGGRQGDRIRAVQQLSGRGQRERRWESVYGDLTCSWLIHEGKIPQNGVVPGMLQLEAALAVLDTIAALSGMQLPDEGNLAMENIAAAGFSVKWPNDIWYEGGKLAGILAESRSFQERLRIVLGIGLNVAVRKRSSAFTTARATLADYNSTIRSIVKIEMVLNAALASILERRHNAVDSGDEPTETGGITDPGGDESTNPEVGELIFASITLHVEKYGNPTMNGEEITLRGIAPSGTLEIIDQSGEHLSIDDTMSLLWPSNSEG